VQNDESWGDDPKADQPQRRGGRRAAVIAAIAAAGAIGAGGVALAATDSTSSGTEPGYSTEYPGTNSERAQDDCPQGADGQPPGKLGERIVLRHVINGPAGGDVSCPAGPWRGHWCCIRVVR
jgi:hypothetical protein